MIKLVAAVSSVLVSLGLAALLPAQPPRPTARRRPRPRRRRASRRRRGARARRRSEEGVRPAPPPPCRRELRGPPRGADPRLDRSRRRTLPRRPEGLQTRRRHVLAREYGAAAHDLARAADHARNAARFDRPDPDLPPPSDDFGPEDARERARRDLNRAYERIGLARATGEPAPGAEFYIKAARDLYTAARRDLEAGRDERAGELARAAEAMTHVPEHLAQAGTTAATFDARPARRRPSGPEPKVKRSELAIPSPRRSARAARIPRRGPPAALAPE